MATTYAYVADRSETGYVLLLANGTTFARSATRDAHRPKLVTSLTNRIGSTMRGLAYTYDDLSRPISRNGDSFGYNERGEVSDATINGLSESHVYDYIGNSLLTASQSATNVYVANALNQYTSVTGVENCSPTYNGNGDLLTFGECSFTYDADSRLLTVSSNGVLLVTNDYDCQGRRVRKATPEAATTFLYDDWNLIRETVVYTSGNVDTFEYFWGRDLSGTLQGAGGVGGLLYVKRNGTIYIPLADANGNITAYVDATGTIVAEYIYDAFGRIIAQSGSLADLFRHRFSSKYHDSNVELYYYGKRFYFLKLERWLTRDPLGEGGGFNLSVIALNNLVNYADYLGLDIIVIRHLPGEEPFGGWPVVNGGQCLALTVYNGPTCAVTEIKCSGGKITFRVDIDPPNSFVHVYFRSLDDYMTKMYFENDHVSVARRHEESIRNFKRLAESIYDCPVPARKALESAKEQLRQTVQALKVENEAYDAPGGKHVLYR